MVSLINWIWPDYIIWSMLILMSDIYVVRIEWSDLVGEDHAAHEGGDWRFMWGNIWKVQQG